MAVELQQLLWAVLVGAGYWAIFMIAALGELGLWYAQGPRDRAPGDQAVMSGRAGRAIRNYAETLPWFIIAVLVSHLAQRVDATTIMAGWVYLGARALYAPAYLLAIPFTRSLIWAVATGAILVIVLRVLGWI